MTSLMVALREERAELRVEYDPVRGKIRVEILGPDTSTSFITDSHRFIALVKQLCTLLSLYPCPV